MGKQLCHQWRLYSRALKADVSSLQAQDSLAFLPTLEQIFAVKAGLVLVCNFKQCSFGNSHDSCLYYIN